MNNIINLLAISASGINNTINQEPTDDPKSKAIWIIILSGIIIASVLIARFVPDVSDTINNRKANNLKSKAEKERSDELERLHKIKKKNKRK